MDSRKRSLEDLMRVVNCKQYLFLSCSSQFILIFVIPTMLSYLERQTWMLRDGFTEPIIFTRKSSFST